MTILDWILVGYLGLSALNGLKAGFVQMVGSIVGLVAGVVLATRWYEPVGAWLGGFVFSNVLVAKVVAFFLVLVVVTRAVGLIFYLIDRVVKIASIIPGIAAINRLGGLALGVVEGVLILAATLWVATRFDISPQWASGLSSSALTPILTGISNVLMPLLPQALKAAQSVLLK